MTPRSAGTAMSSDLDLSDADLRRLGAQVSYHPASSGMHKANLISAICFAVILLGVAVASALFYLRSPNGRGFQWVALGVGLPGVAAAVAAVYLVRKLRWRLQVHENGFALDKSGTVAVV